MLSNKPLFTYFLNGVTITTAAVNDLLQDGTLSNYSAVARGGAGGARAPLVFFLESKKRPV